MTSAKKPIRVLQVMPSMGLGGMESFVMNIYRTIDRSLVQFDFLCHFGVESAYDGEIQELGGNLHRATVRDNFNLPRYFHYLDSLFRAHPEYKVIHGHYSGFGMFYNHYAKKYGVATRIGHSHNTSYPKNMSGTLDRLLSSQFNRNLTHRFACGEDAGQALFGNKPFTIIPNGVDLPRFHYNIAHDEALRRRYGLRDRTVYGHVGRFQQQKNHKGLLEIFASLHKCHSESALLLIGDGPLRQEVERQAHELRLENEIIFAGEQQDICPFYSAMDVFLLPSLFEGLPVVLVEAQAAGLPCYVSDKVSPEADLTGIHFLSIDSTNSWRDALASGPIARQNNDTALRDAGYDIHHSTQMLQQFYLEKSR